MISQTTLNTDTQNRKKVLGVVLAGGRSTRMGQDKALLKINEQSMIERTKSLLESTNVTKVIVSRNDNQTDHFSDLIPGKGPLSGIHSIAARFPHYDLVVVPVDLPLLNAGSIQALINKGVERNANVRFVNHNLPLYLRNSSSVRQVLDYTLRNTNCFSVGRFCSHFYTIDLKTTLSSYMFNTNTPEQWRYALQHFGTDLSSEYQEAHYESL